LCEESNFFLKETPWMAMKIENGNPDLKCRKILNRFLSFSCLC
jgi:hypothetical protein